MSNPILNNNRFSQQEAVLAGEPMTINGTLNKIFLLTICLAAGAFISMYYLMNGQQTIISGLLPVSAVIAFILVLITVFNVKLAKYTAAPYALFEGIFLGTVSSLFNAQWQGIVVQAIGGTVVVLFTMLLLYRARMITYTEKFASVLKTAVLSILVIYLIQFVALFFSRSIPLIFDAGPVGIAFSLIVIFVAAMALIQDFHFIESASQRLLPQEYEWYGAMGLMITLVWLYMEILRLLALLNSRR